MTYIIDAMISFAVTLATIATLLGLFVFAFRKQVKSYAPLLGRKPAGKTKVKHAAL